MLELCEAHLERVGQEVPAYKLGLCEDCFRGRNIGETRKPKESTPAVEKSPNCSRCGKPRHRGSCGGEKRRPFVEPLKIEHATAMLIEGETTRWVAVVSGVPRRVVEEIYTSLKIKT